MEWKTRLKPATGRVDGVEVGCGRPGMGPWLCPGDQYARIRVRPIPGHRSPTPRSAAGRRARRVDRRRTAGPTRCNRTDNGRAMRVRHTRSIRVPAGVPAGVLATITMDVAMVAASRLGGSAFTSDRLGVDVIGRWAADLLRGRWRHDDITERTGTARRARAGSRHALRHGHHPHAGIPAASASRETGDRASGEGRRSASRRPHCRSSCCSPRWATAGSGSGPVTRLGSAGSCSSATPRSASGSGCGHRASQGAGRVRDLEAPARRAGGPDSPPAVRRDAERRGPGRRAPVAPSRLDDRSRPPRRAGGRGRRAGR